MDARNAGYLSTGFPCIKMYEAGTTPAKIK